MSSFDRVNHQRLTARLATRVDDQRLLVLIGRMLKAKVVPPDGVVIGVDEGVPQGSPLSPLLSTPIYADIRIGRLMPSVWLCRAAAGIACGCWG